MQPSTVTVVGSYNASLFARGDRLPALGETVIGDRFWEGPGGKGSNQAVAASKFGAVTRFIARIGNDNYGAEALAMYQRFRIGTRWIRVDDGIHTGIGLVLVDSHGRNMIMVVPGANYRLSIDDIDAAEDAIAGSAIVGFQLENRVEVIEYGLQKAHRLGVKTLLDPAPATKLSAAVYPSIDYIKPNETEAAMLTGIPVTDVVSARKAGRWLVDRGVGTAVVTLGELGAVLVTGEKEEHYPAPKVDAVDSTGAGDVFCGAMMAALSGGCPVEESIEFANQAGALSVTRYGVIEAIPELEELENRLHV